MPRRIICFITYFATSHDWYADYASFCIDDMLKLTIDQIFPPKRRRENADAKVHKVPGYSDTENMWELLCQLGANKGVTSVKGPSVANLAKTDKDSKLKETAAEKEDCVKEETKESGS